MRDADHAPPGGLHLGRDDRDLGADQPVEQGRLADVGRADDRDEPGAGGLRLSHGRPRAIRCSIMAAAARSAARLVAADAVCGGWSGEADLDREGHGMGRARGGDDAIGRRLQAARMRPLLQRHLGIARRRSARSRSGAPSGARRMPARPRSRRRDRWRRSAPRSSRRASPAACAAGVAGLARGRSAASGRGPAPRRPRPGSPVRTSATWRCVSAPSASSGKRSISRCATTRPRTRSPRNSSRS